MGNDLKIHGQRLYAVINCSNLIEVMDIRTARHIGMVSAPNCRYIAFHQGFAYVSSYSRGGYVAKIDTASLTVVAECHVGREPEEMAVVNGRLYVANSGGYTPENLERTVSVIDLATFSELSRIDVAPNLHRMEVDGEGKIWVSSREGGVFCVDDGTAFDIKANDLAIDGNYLYVCGEDGFTTIDILLRRIVGEQKLTELERPYGIFANPRTHEIVVADATDFLTPGMVHCFSPDGVHLWQARTGNIPSRIAFTDHRLDGDNTPVVPPRERVRIYEYTPAPGQFINDGWSVSSPEEAAQWAEERLANGSVVSLGSWGGYIVMGLRVENGEGPDFAVRGNAFGNSSEAGVVWVAQDTDGDGSPEGETWHEIMGSETGVPYSVTYRRDGSWSGSDGKTGIVERNSVHTQDSYYPAWLPDNMVFSGTLLPEKLSNDGSQWRIEAFKWGYADNIGTDYTAGETHLDIPSNLESIDFIKVQTAVLAVAGWLGELSTEVGGVRCL